ncbi:MAG: class I SAM-dependent methyltransferase [bacterium]|nr:class I SAM-dependent methyltransferase [bacterium]
MGSGGLVYDPFSDLSLARRINREYMQLVGIQPGDAVLDIGCGPGDSTEAILGLLWDGHQYQGHVVAFDRDPKAVEMARERFAGKPVAVMECAVENLDQIGFKDGEFDAAVFANGAHYLREAEQLMRALRAIRRVTGGVFALWSAFTRETNQGNSTGRFSGFWVLEAYRLLRKRGYDRPRERTKSENLQDRGREDYVLAFVEAGFRDIETRVTPYPFTPDVYQAIARFADYVANALPSDDVPIKERSEALFAAVQLAFDRLHVPSIDRNYVFVRGQAAA